ncbi:hypothetical protein JA1_004848 [Spathaspora sp. JA1]|nr:hypothetical protein JA1_004848 [Spathaspora sp. JA1]
MNSNGINYIGAVTRENSHDSQTIQPGQRQNMYSQNNNLSFGIPNQFPIRSPLQQFSCTSSDLKSKRYNQQHQQQHQQDASGLRYIRQVSGPLNPSMGGINLRFSNDLNTMIQNWTREEFASSRRLVRFEFDHDSENSVQTISFHPIKPQAVATSSSDNLGNPIISCIFWKEKDRHIATSVDIILILEYLVHQNFGIEEKNRIRRNLQSLKPTTVSRSNKEDCDFFNLIMSMENPRPRNIEKDLKVFNWGDLGKAISKVMSKYSIISRNEITNYPIPVHASPRFGNLIRYPPNSPSLINHENYVVAGDTQPNSYELSHQVQFQFTPPPQAQVMYPPYQMIAEQHYNTSISHQSTRIPPPGLQPIPPPHLLQHRTQVENTPIVLPYATVGSGRINSNRMNNQFKSTPMMRSNYYLNHSNSDNLNNHINSDLNNEEHRISLGIGNDSNSSVSSCNTDFTPEDNILNKQQEENSSTDTSICEKPPGQANKLPPISQMLNSDIKVTCLSLPPIGDRLPPVSTIESWKAS